MTPPNDWPLGAMFDLDGTLLDREPLMLESISAVMTGAGVELTEHEASFGLGRAWQDVHGHLRVEERLGWDLPSFLDRVFVHATELIRRGGLPRVLPGGRELVLACKEAGIPVALVTGSRHAEVVPALAQLELVGVFDEVVAADDYGPGKPAPDAYLLGAKRLGLPANRCVAFEDSEAGIGAALAAGCRVVAAESANLPVGHPARQDLTGASWHVESLAEVTLPGLRSRFSG